MVAFIWHLEEGGKKGSLTAQLNGIDFELRAASGFRPSGAEIEVMMVSERSQTSELKLFKFQLSCRRWEEGRKGAMREEGGGVCEMREELYQPDQSSIPLQSPDKAGTAGGETMCIKTSWRSMASFCQIWGRQKRTSAGNKRERSRLKLVNTKATTARRQKIVDYFKKIKTVRAWSRSVSFFLLAESKVTRWISGCEKQRSNQESDFVPAVFAYLLLQQTAQRQVSSALGA